MLDTHTEPHDPNRGWKPAALTLAFAAAIIVAAGATRLIPYEWRPYNFAAVGALALFAGARIGMLPGIALALGSLLIGDLVMLVKQDFHSDFLPSPSSYVCFALYAVMGWALLRRTESPWKIGGVAVAAGVNFFLVTNFFSWLEQTKPYGYTLAGLMDSYIGAIPFYRGTLTGDLFFAGLLFRLHAVLIRMTVGEAQAAATEEVRA